MLFTRDSRCLTPIMTQNTSANGNAFYSSSGSLFYQPYLAFDGSATSDEYIDGWMVHSPTGIIGYHFTNAVMVNGYNIYPFYAYGDIVAPYRWTLEASNDNANWTVIHSVANSGYWTAGVKKNHTVANSNFYNYYRLNITLNGGDTSLGIGEIEFIGSNLRSTPPQCYAGGI